MKQLTTLVATLLLSFSMFAQDNALKFLGIPVDGKKQEVINALKDKGFTYNPYSETLSGRFNGMDVDVAVLENNGKVHRIAVAEQNGCDEGQIILAYNRLLRQFKDNAKYKEVVHNPELSEREDVSYEMTVHNKQYQAAFCLKNNPDGAVWFTIARNLYFTKFRN